jgi:citrate lyase beta subunit
MLSLMKTSRTFAEGSVAPQTIDAAALGGTLFVPATHKHLEAIAAGEKFPLLRSVVFDTEDGIRSDELDNALKRLQSMLQKPLPSGLLRFIRPRNPDTLQILLQMRCIEKIDGFVLPKFGLDNREAYLEAVVDTPFKIMPSIEGRELFDIAMLRELRDGLLPHRERIIAVRFGAEDMMRQLGLRRDCRRSLFDLCAPSQVIANLMNTFKPHGFSLTAPVFRCFKDTEDFEADVKRDLAEGLLGKTIIHPDQIEPIERFYRVTRRELEEARILMENEEAAFDLGGTMGETATQRPWAMQILRRAELYGIA